MLSAGVCAFYSCNESPTHHYVSSTDKLESGLEDKNIQNVDEVARVVNE